MENERAKFHRLADEDGRTRTWVLLVGSVLCLWSLAIYAYILIAAPAFEELFSGFGADLPSMTSLVLEYSWLAAVLIIVSVIPVIALWRNRSLTTVDKSRDFKRVILAFFTSIVLGTMAVYSFYLPIFKMGAVVS